MTVSLRCYVKSSLLSIIIPKNFWKPLFLIVIVLLIKLGNVLGVPRVIKCYFSEFSTRKFLKNHLPKIEKSLCSFLLTSSKVLPNATKVLSSAKLQTFKLWMNRKTSLITIWKRKGPRIEPWGTPVVISWKLLKSFLILHLWNLFVKSLWTKLNELLSNPCTLNFANNREWSKESNAFDKSIKRAPTLSFLFKIVFQFSVIISGAFWLLRFLGKPDRCF